MGKKKDKKEKDKKEKDKKEKKAKKERPYEPTQTELSASQTRRVSSITRRLQWLLVRRKLRAMLMGDALLFVLLTAGFFLAQEARESGLLPVAGTSRALVREGGELFYKAVNQAQGLSLLVAVKAPLQVLGLALLVLLAVQGMGLVLASGGEARQIRGILEPINAIAIQADRLSRLSFTEDKYQLIEDAITRIQPQDTETLSFGDNDLAGIEAAMNNLLLRMRDTYRQQARFVNDASHELRTPIAVIQGYANMLSRWGKEDEKILDEGIAAICHESDHMHHLVEQLLFLARGDSGKTVLSPERVDLEELTREIYEESFLIDEHHRYRLKGVASGNALRPQSLPPEEQPVVMADRALLKQAVRILVDNAAKYTEEGEEIQIGCGLDGEEAFISVQDTGIGMEPKDVEHMFERFYRSDEARGYQGTGLGLSIAKWIVDRHRGHFLILSRAGIGTRICILLPASA